GDGAHRDEVDAGVGVGACRVEGDTAGNLDETTAADVRDAPRHLGRRHVVEEHHVGSGLERFVELGRGVAPDLDAAPRPAQLVPAHGGLDGEPGQVVVLE